MKKNFQRKLMSTLGLLLGITLATPASPTSNVAQAQTPATATNEVLQLTNNPGSDILPDVLATLPDRLIYMDTGATTVFGVRMIDGAPVNEQLLAFPEIESVKDAITMENTPGQPIVVRARNGIWTTDGSAAGTVKLPVGGSLVAQTSDTLIFFSTQTGLYRSNGTVAGTVHIGGTGYQQLLDKDFHFQSQMGTTVFLKKADGLWGYDSLTDNLSVLDATADADYTLIHISPEDNAMLFTRTTGSFETRTYDLMLSDGTPGGTHVLQSNIISAFGADWIDSVDDTILLHWVEFISETPNHTIYQDHLATLDPQTLTLTDFATLFDSAIDHVEAFDDGAVLYEAHYGNSGQNGEDPPVDYTFYWLDYATLSMTPTLTSHNPLYMHADREFRTIPLSDTQTVLQTLTTKLPDGTNKCEMWALGHTAAETFQFPKCKDFNNDYLVRLGSGVLMRLDLSTGNELWMTDGTAAGTVQIGQTNLDLFLGVTTKPNGSPVAIYAATDETYGTELWGSDGTLEGTDIVIDMSPGPMSTGFESAWPGNVSLTERSDGLYVAAGTPEFGYEIWRTNGTAEGTLLITDLASGPSSGIERIVPVDWAGHPDTILVVSSDSLPNIGWNLFAITEMPDLQLHITGQTLFTESTVSLDFSTHNNAFYLADTMALNLDLPSDVSVVSVDNLSRPEPQALAAQDGGAWTLPLPGPGATTVWRVTLAMPAEGSTFDFMATLDNFEPVQYTLHRATHRVLLPKLQR